MSREISRTRAWLNAFLALAILAAAGFGATLVARRHWQWQETFTARVEMMQVGGVELGGKVRIQGMDAGVVEAIVPPSAPGRPVTLVLKLDERLRGLVRSDATARIAAQGVIGAKVVEILPGRDGAPPLAEGGILRAEPAVELADLMKDASTVLRRVDSIAKAAEEGLGNVNAIVAEVRAGRGSLGKLVRDDEAYRRLVAMSARGEKTLGDLDENLAAMKRTWPLSRYFNGRGFDDRDRVLFQPGSTREGLTLRGDDLFDPGSAVLKPSGRQRAGRRGSLVLPRPPLQGHRGRDRRLLRRPPRRRGPDPGPHREAGRGRPQLPHQEPLDQLHRLVLLAKSRRRRLRDPDPPHAGRRRRRRRRCPPGASR